LESTEETVVEVPAESEEEIDDPVNEGEVDDQSILPKCSGRVSRPPFPYSIDDYSNTANMLSN